MKSLGRKIPREVDGRTRKEIRALDADWEIRASKNQYFLYVDDKQMACIGSSGSIKRNYRVHKMGLTTMKRNLRCI